MIEPRLVLAYSLIALIVATGAITWFAIGSRARARRRVQRGGSARDKGRRRNAWNRNDLK